MARTFGWRSVAVALAAATVTGCTESLSGVGQCPELCPSEGIQVVDTVLTGVVVSDTSFRGFKFPSEVPIIVLSSISSARSIAVIRFTPRVPRIPLPFDTAGAAIQSVDSVAMELSLVVRDTLAHNVRVLAYRLPKDLVDTATTYQSILPFFDDSLLIDSLPVPDSVASVSLRRFVPRDQVEPDSADSGVVAIGLSVRADIPTSVTITSVDRSGSPPILRYYLRGTNADTTVRYTAVQAPTFDTFLSDPLPDPIGSAAMVVGNLPSARALLRFNVPRRFIDSTTIVRATLLLNLLRPVGGRPSEITDIQAVPVLRDFGGKSVLILDDAVTGTGRVTAGTSDTVRIEMAKVLRYWKVAGDSIPRAIVLRNQDEDVMLGEIQVARSGAGASAPRLHLTFLRPYRFGVP